MSPLNPNRSDRARMFVIFFGELFGLHRTAVFFRAVVRSAALRARPPNPHGSRHCLLAPGSGGGALMIAAYRQVVKICGESPPDPPTPTGNGDLSFRSGSPENMNRLRAAGWESLCADCAEWHVLNSTQIYSPFSGHRYPSIPRPGSHRPRSFPAASRLVHSVSGVEPRPIFKAQEPRIRKSGTCRCRKHGKPHKNRENLKIWHLPVPESGITCRPQSTTCRKLATTCRPASTTCRNLTTTCRPASTTCRNLTTTCRPASTTCRNLATTCRPESTTCRNLATTCRPASTTRFRHRVAFTPRSDSHPAGDKPGFYRRRPHLERTERIATDTRAVIETATTCRNLTTTCRPASTTCRNLTTTCRPASTTCRNLTTTCRPASTTCRNLATTCRPESTTCRNLATTCRPASTTRFRHRVAFTPRSDSHPAGDKPGFYRRRPHLERTERIATDTRAVIETATTCRNLTTTCRPASTTCRNLTTTCRPASTTCRNLTTTCRPASTTCRNLTTTCRPASDTLQVLKTTCRPASTTRFRHRVAFTPRSVRHPAGGKPGFYRGRPHLERNERIATDTRAKLKTASSSDLKYPPACRSQSSLSGIAEPVRLSATPRDSFAFD